jgi:hypothetical protein
MNFNVFPIVKAIGVGTSREASNGMESERDFLMRVIVGQGDTRQDQEVLFRSKQEKIHVLRSVQGGFAVWP